MVFGSMSFVQMLQFGAFAFLEGCTVSYAASSDTNRFILGKRSFPCFSADSSAVDPFDDLTTLQPAPIDNMA